jgi:uncharacterized protein YbaR (Trm112 family)
MDRELLDILACPKCKGPLEAAPGGEGLRCPACRLFYRIEDDIPVLLVEEATPCE